MVYRHSIVTRVTHGVFGLAFAGLALTGTQLYLHAHWLRNAGSLHQLFAILMVASGLTYLLYAGITGQLKKLLLSARDIPDLVPMALYYLRLRTQPPAFEWYNPLQKLAYTIVLLMLGPFLAATGLALWPHLQLVKPLAAVFGGRRSVVVWHIGFALELVLFFFGHMLMVATTGLRENLRAIVTGWASQAQGSVRAMREAGP